MTDAGFWIASMPATLLPVSSSVETLGAAVGGALAAGAARVPTPSKAEYRAVQAALLEVARVRSWVAVSVEFSPSELGLAVIAAFERCR